MPSKKDEFEIKLQEFEKCCLEAENLDLNIDEMMESYVQGRRLYQECLEILEEKKQKFETIRVED